MMMRASDPREGFCFKRDSPPAWKAFHMCGCMCTGGLFGRARGDEVLRERETGQVLVPVGPLLLDTEVLDWWAVGSCPVSLQRTQSSLQRETVCREVVRH